MRSGSRENVACAASNRGFSCAMETEIRPREYYERLDAIVLEIKEWLDEIAFFSD